MAGCTAWTTSTWPTGPSSSPPGRTTRRTPSWPWPCATCATWPEADSARSCVLTGAPELGAEHVLADLAGRGEREAVGEHPAGRGLVGGEPGPAVPGQLGLGGRGVGRPGPGQADDGADLLAPEPVGDPDHRGLGHPRVAG